MAFLGQLIYYIHILAGATTLVAGPLAIFFNDRRIKWHRIAGQVFFYAMLIVSVSAIVSFLKQPERPFFQFLLGIALFVLSGILRGVRAARMMKGAPVLPFDYAYAALMGANGLYMVGMAIWHLSKESAAIFPVLFGAFGIACLGSARMTLRILKNASSLHRLDWLRLHLGTMIGAFTASTTAFTVQTASFLPWPVQWFGPALALMPLQVYFARKIKARKARLEMGELPEAQV